MRYVFDQQPQASLAFARQRRWRRCRAARSEAFQVVGELKVGVAVSCLGVERVDLGAQAGLACAQVRHPGAQFVDSQKLLGERLDHGGDRAGSLRRLKLEAVPLSGDRVGGAGGLRAC